MPAAAARPDAARRSVGPLARRARSVRQSAAHTSLTLAGRRRRHPGRAHPPAPGVPQSHPERDRRPGRRRRVPRFAIALGRDGGEATLSFADGGPGFPADIARARVRALRDDQGQGHRPRARDREEDRRRARRPRRSSTTRAARRARHARVPVHAAAAPAAALDASTPWRRQGNPDRRRRSRHPRAALRDPAGRGLSRRARRERAARRARTASGSSRRWCCSTSGCPTPTA